MFKKIRQFKQALEIVQEDKENLLERNSEPSRGKPNAVFMPDGTSDDYKDYIDSQTGWKQLTQKFKDILDK